MDRRAFLKRFLGGMAVAAVAPAVVARALEKAAPAAVEVPSRLTLAKLVRAKFLLDSNEVTEDGRTIYWSARQMNELLKDVDQVSPETYAEVRALVTGKVDHFLGFDFVHTQLVENAKPNELIGLARLKRKLGIDDVRWINGLPISAWWDGRKRFTVIDVEAEYMKLFSNMQLQAMDKRLCTYKS